MAWGDREPEGNGRQKTQLPSGSLSPQAIGMLTSFNPRPVGKKPQGNCVFRCLEASYPTGRRLPQPVAIPVPTYYVPGGWEAASNCARYCCQSAAQVCVPCPWV